MRRTWTFFVGAMVAYALVWIWQVVALPARVPRHWDAAGAPDQFTSRTESLAQSALVGLAVVALFVLLAWAVTQAPVEQRRPLMEDLWVVGALTLGFLAVREVVTLPDLRTESTHLTVFVLVVLYAALVLAWCVGAYRSRYAGPIAPHTPVARRPR